MMLETDMIDSINLLTIIAND